jgi:hypothetical protein
MKKCTLRRKVRAVSIVISDPFFYGPTRPRSVTRDYPADYACAFNRQNGRVRVAGR